MEQLSSLNLFFDTYDCICAALETISNQSFGVEAKKAHSMLCSIKNSGLILALVAIRAVFSLSRSLSIYLQTEGCDFSRAMSFIMDPKSQFHSMRSNSSEEARKLYEEAEKLAHNVDVELKCTPRFKAYENCEYNIEVYFRQVIFIPFLGHTISEMIARFLAHDKLYSRIQDIIPHKAAKLTQEEMKITAKFFQEECPLELEVALNDFQMELLMWTRYDI